MDVTARLALAAAIKITIFLLMVALGMGVRPGDLLRLWRRPRLLVGCLAAAFLIVPAVAYAVFQILPLSFDAQAGLWAIAITAGAPMTYRSALKRGLGDPGLAASFQVTVALAVIIFAPVWLSIISALSDRNYGMPPLQILRQVATVQLVPILIGLSMGRWAPDFAGRAQGVLAKIGGVGLAVVVVALLAILGPRVIASAEVWTILAAFLIATAAAASGHTLAGPETASRVTIANADVQRNPGLALAILTWNLRDSAAPAIVVVVTYALVGVVVAAVYTNAMKRLGDLRHRPGLAGEAT